MRALSGELGYRIRYDVEHDLFHAQNVFNDEYIKPTFIEYVQKLEKENAELKAFKEKCKFNVSDIFKDIETEDNITKAKEIIKALLKHTYGQNLKTQNDFDLYLGRIKEAEQFLKEE